MSRRRRYTVCCLAGHGIGPELVAEASRALAEISRLHGFAVEEAHAPFGGEALTRSGHRLPPATRSAALGADAVLVAVASEPALAGVKAELDAVAQVTRVRLAPAAALTVFSPLASAGAGWAIERAFAAARSGSVTSIAAGPAWRERVEAVAAGHDGVLVRHLTLAEALPALADDPSSLDVVVTEQVLAEAVASVPRGRRVAATGLLSPAGPSLFLPSHGSAPDIAGQGVADPSELLLATALMLGEGLGRRAAADTLEASVAAALASGVRTPARVRTTRELADTVLSLLPASRRDLEFAT